MELEITSNDKEELEVKEIKELSKDEALNEKPNKEEEASSKESVGKDEAKDSKKTKAKRKTLPLICLIIGILALLGGGTFLALKLILKPGMRDAEFLVQMGEWTREDAEGVIWNFTEIGKGTLTTNNHQNDYDFLWSIDGDTLKIETKWLYDLNDEYTYKLQQDNKTLTLSSKTKPGSDSDSDSDSGEELANINFRATGSVDTEITEND